MAETSLRKYIYSTSCGAFSTTSTSYVDVTNLTLDITGTGRLIRLELIHDGDTAADHDGRMGPFYNAGTLSDSTMYVRLVRVISGSPTEIACQRISFGIPSAGNCWTQIPVSSFQHIDYAVLSGTLTGPLTYKIQTKIVSNAASSAGAQIYYAKLMATLDT